MQLRAGGATHAGQVRTGNEDAQLVADADGLWAVADGMGGHRGGEVASRLAVQALREAYVAGEQSEGGLAEAAAAANAAVVAAGEEDPDLRGMGTTLVAVARTADDEIAYVNVGDSRIYLLRDGELQRLTIDHSLVEELVQEGALTPEEARTHPRRNVVTRAIGMGPVVPVDAATIVPYTGDRFLLCSDGLTSEVEEDRIAATLRRIADPGEAANELVRLANEAGGRDNVTVVVVDVLDDGGRAEQASRQVPATATSDDLAGPGTAGAASATGVAPGRATRAERRAARHATGAPKLLTWRVVAFAVAVLAVLGAAAWAIGAYARGTYFVGVDGEGIAIFKGKPGGVLWFDPTLERRTDLAPADLRAEVRDDVDRGVEFASIGEAEAFLQRNTTTTTTPTTSTTTTTTTAAPPTAATEPPATGAAPTP